MIVTAIFLGVYNAIRGHGIKWLGQKPIELLLFAGFGYSYGGWWGLLVPLPVALWFTETGDIMAGITGKTAWYRRYGIAYATLVGIAFTIPFIPTNLLFGLPCAFLGVLCFALRGVDNRWVWRAIEFGYFAMYVLLYALSTVYPL